MRIRNLHVEASPWAADRIRLSATVSYQDHWAGPEIVWYEVPGTLADQASRSGDPWLIALLPLAIVVREQIDLGPLPLDDGLLANADRLMSIWSRWYPELQPVAIVTDAGASPVPAGEAKTAALFSGGVDSLYTLFYDRTQGEDKIDELILIHGADIPIANRAAFDDARASAQRVAEAVELPLVTIATNLRSTMFRLTNWNSLSFGALMAACVLMLEGRYALCLIPSTGRRGAIPPLGSHPETDPLFSTSRTHFVHHGGWSDRIRKTEMISQHPIALENLRVCWESETGGNCGRCGKCLRTMATLDVLGKLAVCSAFGSRPSLMAPIRHLYLGHERPFMLDVRDFAAERGRADLVEAIDAAVRRTDRLNRWLRLGQAQELARRMYHSAYARRFVIGPYTWLVGLRRWIGRRAR
jgi:hypothetical protein